MLCPPIEMPANRSGGATGSVLINVDQVDSTHEP
jgi:hypothetical protein